MLKDFPSPENEKDIEFYEKEIAKFYYGEIELVSIETIPQENTDSLTLFIIDDLNQSGLTK